MRIIAKRTLKEFWDTNPDSENSLLEWHDTVVSLSWNTPNAVKAAFSNASIIDNNRVVFNIKGNGYRLITHIDYTFGIVFVLWIGSHADYDKIDSKKVEFKRRKQ
jgi:mRNA interferase HigB